LSYYFKLRSQKQEDLHKVCSTQSHFAMTVKCLLPYCSMIDNSQSVRRSAFLYSLKSELPQKKISGLRKHHLNITANLHTDPLDAFNDCYMQIPERYIKIALQSKQILKENKIIFLSHAYLFLQH